MPAATLNYTIQDFGDKYVVSPVTGWDTLRGADKKTNVTLDADGKLTVAPKRAPKPEPEPINKTSQQIFGGYLFVPKNVDLSKPPVLRCEGPAKQVLRIDLSKLA